MFADIYTMKPGIRSNLHLLLIPVLISVVACSNMRQSVPDRWWQLFTASQRCMWQGYYRAATANAYQALLLAHKQYRSHHPRLGLSMVQYGRSLLLAGYYKRAARHLETAAQVMLSNRRHTSALAREVQGQRIRLAVLAGDLPLARRLAQAIRESRVFFKNPSQLEIVLSLTLLARFEDKPQLSRQLLEKVSNPGLDPEAHKMQLDARFWQARALTESSLGHHTQARKLLHRAALLRKRHCRPLHPDQGRTSHGAGILAFRRGELKQAAAHFRNALGLWLTSLGPHHPALGICHNNLGEVLKQLGNPQPAMRHFHQALFILEKRLGRNNIRLAPVCNNLGLLLAAEEQHKAAEPFLVRALLLQRKQWGKHHRRIVISLNNLGNTYFMLEKHTLAEMCYLQGARIAARLGQDERPLLHSLGRSLVLFYRAQGRREEAEALATALRENRWQPPLCTVEPAPRTDRK